MSDAAAEHIAVACSNVTVRYGDVTALDDVSVAFERGRIHAVLGQNGAGKTTFARVCAGIVRPSSGSVHIGQHPLALGDVGDARAAGVELVHQNFALPPSFTVAEAMEFGNRRRPGSVFGKRALEARWRTHLESLGVNVRADARIRDLSVETQQAVEIARALAGNARVLILDEPTAVLAPAAIGTLFDNVRRLRAQGVTIVLILHKIREVLAVAETVTVLRAGRVIERLLPAAGIDPARLAADIVGDTPLPAPGPAAAHVPHTANRTQAALAMEGVSSRTDRDGPMLEGIDLRVDRGEIVGVAGVENNGQLALVRTIAGLVPATAGRLALGDRDVTAASPLERRACGVRIIPFERNVEGLSLGSSLWENWSVRTLLRGSLLRTIDRAGLRIASGAAFARWDVRFRSVEQLARSLSGGNAQKIILAREIDDDAGLIVAAQPTRGLDVGATAFVWSALRDARDAGRGVLLISSDLDELFDVCDRVVVMSAGRIAGTFLPPYDIAAVGAAMMAASA
jgi:ABC-type uncharacterized transport system ATPase subunit